VISSATHEFVSVDVTANTLTLKAIDITGAVIDTFQLDQPE
jgi:hypothetical protein